MKQINLNRMLFIAFIFGFTTGASLCGLISWLIWGRISDVIILFGVILGIVIMQLCTSIVFRLFTKQEPEKTPKEESKENGEGEDSIEESEEVNEIGGRCEEDIG